MEPTRRHLLSKTLRIIEMGQEIRGAQVDWRFKANFALNLDSVAPYNLYAGSNINSIELLSSGILSFTSPP